MKKASPCLTPVQEVLALVLLSALVACTAPIATSPTPTPVPSIATPTTLAPNTPTVIPTTSPSMTLELSFNEYPLKKPPEPESLLLYFADSVQDDPLLIHASERSKVFAFFDSSCILMNGLGRCVRLGADTLIAQENYHDQSYGTVTLTRNGEPIYEIPIGQVSPIDGLRGLWAYGEHWALETAYITERSEGNVVYSDALGQVSVDGVLLNEEYGYDEVFGFQTIHDRPFYFFKQNGRIDAWYDSTDVPLGYDEVLHYGCCSSATLNPHMSKDMVAFFARRGEVWYYAEIGVFGDQ